MRLLKERLDILLVNKGFFTSRERAKTAIMAGDVYVGGAISDKAGTKIDVDAEITVKNDQCPFVGRGGYKLAKAIEAFDVDLSEKTAMDIGASTGGFTDCMLQNGARRVYAVDVGYGQLDWKLREDERVVNMEKTNVRYLEADAIAERLDFVSIDVSFISLKLIFPVARRLMKDGAVLVCLIKPQFEAGRSQVGKKGIVRDKAVHREVIEKVMDYAAANGLRPSDLTFSPMTGAKGNIEYLLKAEAVELCGEPEYAGEPDSFQRDVSHKLKERIGAVVEEAHRELAK